jgi:exoribonuclease R
MKPKLDSLELFLKNFKIAIKQGDKPTAQGLLNRMGETVKGLEDLLAK